MITDIIYSNNHFSIYIIGAIIFHWTYFMADKILVIMNEHYRNLNDDKKKYVVSNINKSLLLGGITPIAGNILYNSIYTGVWNNNLIKNMGIFYSIPDTVSILVVNKMDLTTKIHHTVVIIFNFASIYNDYNENNIFRCMLVYACFSAFAYMVNFQLGARFLHKNKKIDNKLSLLAFVIYFISCFTNWSYHYYTLKDQWSVCSEPDCYKILIYLLMISTIAVDDLKLMKWLFNKSRLLTY